MSVLRNIERGIEGLVERGFRRAFKSSLQPVELARKLAREMDDHKTVSVSRVYGPNEFHVYLATDDRAAFESYETALTAELETYLEAHAAAAGLSLVARPVVSFETDADLHAGEFGISCRMAEDVPEAPAAPEPDDEAPEIPAPAPAPPPVAVAAPNRGLAGVSGTQVLTPAAARQGAPALAIVVGGNRHRVAPGVTVLGRSRECDIVVADPNVSRRHAEVRLVGTDWIVTDLGSTNGVEVGGRRVGRHVLEDGEELLLGTARLHVEID